MAYVLFVDESGQDHRDSPYEVLGGVAVEDSRIWPLITAIHEAESAHFGGRVSRDAMELKAKRLLKTKTFKLASQLEPFAPEERTRLAKEALAEGVSAKAEQRDARQTRRQLTALAQSKLAFCLRVLELCAQHQVRAFASIVAPDAPKSGSSERNILRKDYAYLFERFFLFLREEPAHAHGIVVFDELERSQSHILINQMSEYFKKTKKGRMRASRVLPEPMFVHSDLTSLIQVADLLVYIVSWGVRIKGMSRPPRPELADLASAVLDLRFRTVIDNDAGTFRRWSFAYIEDLRPLDERKDKEKKAMALSTKASDDNV